MSAQKDRIVLALSKGRIYEETVPLLAKMDLLPTEDPATSRKLIIPVANADMDVLVVRATDVPTYVDYGAADIGIAGKDVLLEHDSQQLYEWLDLGIGRCRLMLAGRPGRVPCHRRLRIATKYSRIAYHYFAKRGKQVDLIKLYGSMELAPLVGLADYIVDLVETGNTLKANGLIPMETIMPISSYLIINKAAMKAKYPLLHPILEAIKAALSQSRIHTLPNQNLLQEHS